MPQFYPPPRYHFTRWIEVHLSVGHMSEQHQAMLCHLGHKVDARACIMTMWNPGWFPIGENIRCHMMGLFQELYTIHGLTNVEANLVGADLVGADLRVGPFPAPVHFRADPAPIAPSTRAHTQVRPYG